MSTLEVRFRRLLVVYPRDHRSLHQQEILGVLLDASDPGRRRPSLRDAVDLIRGGLLVRLHRAAMLRRDSWPDAFGIVAVLAPVFMCLLGVVAMSPMISPNYWPGADQGTLFVQMLPSMAWLLVLALAIAGARRTAAVAAWVTALALPVLGDVEGVLGVSAGFIGGPSHHFEWFALGLLAATALTWSAGPARGIESLGRHGLSAYIGGVVVLGTYLVAVYLLPEGASWRREMTQLWPLFLLGVLLIALVFVRAKTSAGMRASLLLSPPLAAIAVTFFQQGIFTGPTNPWVYSFATTAHYALPAALFLGVFSHMRIAERRREAPPHHSQLYPSPNDPALPVL